MPSFERCVVLVADDEPGILRIVSASLARHGYEVITAPDGPSALRSCQERDGPIHLAVLDVMMPGMSGPELFERLREFHPAIAVLFMSGYSARSIAEYAPVLVHANFIAKPFFPRSLVERVNEILGNEDVCVLLDNDTGAVNA